MVASQLAKGTFKILARVFAKSVLPQPVGPINKILSEATGQDLKKVQKDTDRDYYMSAEQAKEYGLIDEIFYTRKTKK